MDYVYGQLNEKVSKNTYTGVNTDTAEIHVDNSSMTISVDFVGDSPTLVSVLFCSSYANPLIEESYASQAVPTDTLGTSFNFLSGIKYRVELIVNVYSADIQKHVYVFTGSAIFSEHDYLIGYKDDDFAIWSDGGDLVFETNLIDCSTDAGYVLTIKRYIK